jgi:hypothetical protein
MTTTCNGWRNAATWTVNLWFGDAWASMDEDGVEITPEMCREDVERYVEEIAGAPEAGNGFLWDMLDLNAVDWQELADHHTTIVEG